MAHGSKLSLMLVLCAAMAGCTEDDSGLEPGGGSVLIPDTGTTPAPVNDGGAPNPTPNNPAPGVDSSMPNPTPGIDSSMPNPTPTKDSSTPNPTPEAGVPDATTPVGDGSIPKTDAGPVEPGPGNMSGPEPTEATIMADGPCGQTSFTAGFKRPSGVDSATVWVPSKCEGPFASVAVVPGFVSPESSIRQWGPFLASHGIVTVTIGVPGGDQPGQRATKLMGTLASIIEENTRSGSPLMGKLDVTRQGVAGWSMGGGGTLINAANFPDKLKAAVSFAAWGPTGGSKNKTPVLMFEATADALAANMSDGFFRDTPATTPKMLFEVQGSSHNVANSPKNHGNVIGAYGLSWFKTYLVGDTRYKKFLMRPFPSICTRKSAHNLM